MSLLQGKGDGTFQAIPGNYHFYGISGGGDFAHTGNIAIADVTDDEHAEFIVPLYYSGCSYVIRMTPILDDTNTLLEMRYDGYALLPDTTSANTTHPVCVAVGDLNGDGKPDVVVGRESGTSILNVFLNVFSGTSTVQVPTGAFDFKFPDRDASIASIFDISGNYTGVTPTKNQRPYDLDVAVDSAGKIDAMGTIDGIEPKPTTKSKAALSANIAPFNMSVGKLSTVQGQPTASINGKFSGTRDGVAVSANGSFKGLVGLQDIGGGAQGVEGQGSYHANIGGIVSKSSNVTVPFAVSETEAANLKKNWSFKLTIAKKAKSKNTSFVASGELHLQNGDVIKFGDQPVRYSARTGFTIAFQKGQNVTLVPPAVDKKATISIRHLTMAQQNGTWEPTGGKLTYQFMGQKGSGDILSFVSTP